VSAHAPLVQTSPVPQVCPQAPQLMLSVAVFAQYGEALLGVHLVKAPQVSVQVLPWAVMAMAICLLSAPAALVVIVNAPVRTAPAALVVGMMPATIVRCAVEFGARSAVIDRARSTLDSEATPSRCW
jgi:hypothetical protein